MIKEVGVELDRQLTEQRASSDALATRSGLMVAVTGALLGFASTRNLPAVPGGNVAYWLVGVAAILAVLVFSMGRIQPGPTASLIVRAKSADDLVNAKLVLVEANGAVLQRAQTVFAGQVLLTIVGIAVLAWRLWS